MSGLKQLAVFLQVTRFAALYLVLIYSLLIVFCLSIMSRLINQLRTNTENTMIAIGIVIIAAFFYIATRG